MRFTSPSESGVSQKTCESGMSIGPNLCAFAEEDGFYDAAASSSCGEAVVYGSVTNYALTRLAESVASLRTRLCDVLGSPSDDCFLGYLTVSGRRRT